MNHLDQKIVEAVEEVGGEEGCGWWSGPAAVPCRCLVSYSSFSYYCCVGLGSASLASGAVAPPPLAPLGQVGRWILQQRHCDAMVMGHVNRALVMVGLRGGRAGGTCSHGIGLVAS